jgi:hypothetical protein
MTPEQKAAYVAGIFDGEGHIGCARNKNGRHWSRQIQFCNTDKGLVDLVVAYMLDLGINVRVYHKQHNAQPRWSDKWTAYVTGGKRSYQRFAELIPIQSEAKIRALRFLLDHSYTDLPDMYAKRRNGRSLPCAICDQETYRSAAFLSRNQTYQRSGEVYCSSKCRGVAQRRRIIKTCETCHQAYEAKQALAELSRFCSRACQSRHASRAEQLRSQAKAAAEARWAQAATDP